MAIQTWPGRIIFPWTSSATSVSSGAILLNDTANSLDEAAAIIQFPSTGTLTALTFSTSTVTTGQNGMIVRIESLDASGNPSGSLYVANSEGTVDIASGDDNAIKAVSINGGTGVTVTKGEFAAVRIRSIASPPGVSTFDGAVLRYASVSPVSALVGSIQDYNVTAGTAWTKTPGCIYMGLNIGGVWQAGYGMLGGVFGSATTEAYQDPVEKGILINLPVSVRVTGAVGLVAPAAATSFKYVIYSDPLGTPAVHATTIDIDTDFASGTPSRTVPAVFSASVTLAANTDYVLAMAPQGATNLSLGYLVGDPTYRTAYPGGSAATWYSSPNVATDPFTEVSSGGRIPLLGIIIDGIDLASGGGVPFIIGG